MMVVAAVASASLCLVVWRVGKQVRLMLVFWLLACLGVSMGWVLEALP